MGAPGASGTTEDGAAWEGPPPAPPKPYLFVVLHCDRPLAGGARYGLDGVDRVTLGRGASREAARRDEAGARTLAIQLPGNTVSSAHARLVRDGGGWTVEDAGSRNGTQLNGERVGSAPLRDGDLLEIGQVLLRYRAALPTPHGTAPDLDSAAAAPPAPGLLTLLPELAGQAGTLARIAPLPIPVLLLGESGTGKEVMARATHALSERSGPFVAVNCGGLTGTLLESQLFGHVKGAFTGATRDEPGYVRSAHLGTLFLDEIGDLPLPAQAAFLRVLQEREVAPVGGTRPVKVDLRVLAATHRPLELMVMRGEFRGDLLARLSGYRHWLSPLRARIEDLGLLARDLLQRSQVPGAAELRMSPAAGRQLARHPWPLNVRELEQALSVAAALARDGVVEPAHLSEALLKPAPPPAEAAPGVDLKDPEALRKRLQELLEKHQGRVSHVAREMGKARMQIHRWMERLGIDPDDYRRRAT